MRVAYYNESIRCYSDGRIERLFRGKYWREVEQTNINSQGYLTIKIDGKSKKWHRVVWEAFNGHIPNGLIVNHKDEVKTNNALDNLELLTIGENNRYGTRIKRITEANSQNIVGISTKDASVIEFSSIAEAGRSGFNAGNISSCLNRRFGYKTHKGYKWYYREEYYNGQQDNA